MAASCIDMLIEIVGRSGGMPIVGRAKFARLLPLHGGGVHAVVVHQHQRAVVANDNVVGLEVAMGKGLAHQPRGHAAELIGDQLQGVWAAQVLLDPFVERRALHPVHEQHREFGITA